MRKLLLSALIILTIIVIGFTTFVFMSKPVPEEQVALNNTTEETESSQPTIAALSPISQQKLAPTDVRTQIVTAIFSENYSPLASFMTEQVTVRVEGQDCCGVLVYPEAIKKLDEIRGGGTWSFIDSDVRIGKLKTHSPNYYVEHDAIVGVSDAGYSVSFQLNDLGRIYVISLSKDFNALLQ